MDKSRQRKYPTVKSYLNFVRESLLVLISCFFWIYIAIVMTVYIGTLFQSQAESVITIRIALNIENTEIFNMLKLLSIFAILILIFFTISLFYQLYMRKRGK